MTFDTIIESHINATEGHFLCDDIAYPIGETIFSDDPNPGDVYRYALREFGRCTSSIYVDTADGVKRIGWVFVKRERYEDCDETYLHETRVTLARKVADARPAEFAGIAL